MKKIFFLIGLIFLISLLFGCSAPSDIICEKEEVAKILEKYPEIELESLQRIESTDFIKDQNYWEELCNINIEVSDYYKAVYEDNEAKIEVLAESSKLNIICIIENLKTPIIIEEEPDINNIINNINPDENCVESWECSAWSECINEEQIRNCTETNQCETELNKPSELQSCEEECESVWMCFEWEECINGFQERECVKINECDIGDAPITSQTCEN